MYEVFCLTGEKPVRIMGGLPTRFAARDWECSGPDRMIELEEAHEPAVGSVWTHRNGVRYEVVMLVNRRHRRGYPRTVVYKNRLTDEMFSRRATDWHRSMTAVVPAAKWPRQIGLPDYGVRLAPCAGMGAKWCLQLRATNGAAATHVNLDSGDALALSAAIMDAVKEIRAKGIQP